jgi:hypothetical protein
LKKMMNVFVFDASGLTDELFQTRLDNMLSRRDHLENFVKSSINPKQFPDFSHRLHEISADTLLVWGRETASCRWTPACACWPACPRRSCMCSTVRPLGAVGTRRQVQPHGPGLPDPLIIEADMNLTQDTLQQLAADLRHAEAHGEAIARAARADR